MADKKQPEWGLNIQKEVQDIRRKYNLSREDVASKLGISGRTIYRWERGESFPKSRLMVREFEKLKQELEKGERSNVA
ncbi:MAG: helix-turn-helix transcriptional regulator [bacterium]|nr:helix-turn-helix transcriptional regulator [bacterium]